MHSRKRADHGDLIWGKSKLKYLMEENNLWPSFIGFNPDNLKHKIGMYPVLIWPEQRRIISERMVSTKKRRRVDDDKEVEKGVKRIKNDATSLFASIANTVRSLVGSIAGVFGRSTANNGVDSTIGGVLISTSLKEHGLDEDSVQAGDDLLLSENDDDDVGPQPANQDSAQSNVMDIGGPSTAKIASNSDFAAIKEKVFKSMHDKGFLISPGDVFGGDYCLYRGTAAESHSVATVRVLEADGKMSAREFLAFARVQNQVAKSAVIAFTDPETSDAIFLTSMFSGVSCRE